MSEDAVKVTAADFNGSSWDGPPFRPAPAWLAIAVEAGAIAVHPSDTDYALWTVRTPDGERIAAPGDYIIRDATGALSVRRPA